MAVFDSFDYLEEDILDERVVAEVCCLFGDLREEVAIGAVRENDVDASRCLDDIVQGDDVRVGRSQGVEGDLAALEPPLPAVQAGLVETLDGVVFAVASDGLVDDSVCANADDRDELESSIVDLLAGQVLVKLLSVCHCR